MKIGIDGRKICRDQKVGVDNYSDNMIRNLIRSKEISYLIYINSKEGHPPEYIRENPNVEIKNLSLVKNPIIWSQIYLPTSLIKEKIDLFYSPIDYIPLPLNKHETKYIGTIHDLAPLFFPKHTKLAHSVRTRIQLFQLAHLAEGIISVSESTKKDFIKRFPYNEEFIPVIPESYNSLLFHDDNVIKNKKPDKKIEFINNPYILFVGTRQPRKNLVRILSVFDKIASYHKKIRLVIVGKKGWMWNKIRETYNQLNNGHRVIFTGYLEDRYMPTIYNKAELFLYPSLYEGFGIPILESQAMSCPVITSNTSSLPEVGGEGAYYVNPYSEEDIENAILKLLENKQLRKQLIEKGKENINNYSWAESAQKLISFFYKVTNAR